MKLPQELQSRIDAMGIEIPAFSVQDLQTNKMLSFIKVYPEGMQPQHDIINKMSPIEAANNSLFVEACQGFVQDGDIGDTLF
jgi:hypothetical protein